MTQPIVVCDVYARKSTEDTTGTSMPGQDSDCLRDIESLNWIVGERLSDENRSASRFARKTCDDWEVQLDRIGSGACQAISLWESSRGSRKLSEWANFLELCREQRVLIRVASHRTTYEMWNPRHWRTLAEDGVDAQHESERLAQRTRRGKEQAALAGRPNGATQYGYRREYDRRGHYVRQVEEPAQAEIVRELFRRVVAGDPLRTIIRDLNERGMPAPKGGRWAANTIRHIISHRAYLGQRTHHGVVVAEDCWEALVDFEPFEDANRILNDPGRRTQRGNELKYMLSGIILCGVCAAEGQTVMMRCRWRTMTTRPGGAKSRKYLCKCWRNSIAADPVDKMIERLVRARLRSPDAADVFRPEVVPAGVVEARREAAKLQQRLDDAVAQYNKGELSAVVLASVDRDLTPKIEAAKQLADYRVMPPLIRGLKPAEVADRWPWLTTAQHRTVVDHLCELVMGPSTALGSTAVTDLHMRLRDSRWKGDTRTWGEIWATDASDLWPSTQ